jgi:hypothetical protein
MNNFLRLGRLPLFVFGLLLFFIGERYLANESYSFILRIISLLVVGLGVLCPLLLSGIQKGNGLTEEAKSWMTAFSWQFCVFLSACGYLVYIQLLGSSGTPETFLQKAAMAAYLILMILGAISGMGAEFAIRECGTGPLAESLRVSRSAKSWLKVAFLLVALFGFNFAAAKKDIVSDWSYLKTTSPSGSTAALVKTATEDIEIALFYPQSNDVRMQVSQYFDELGKLDSHLKVSYFDKDIHPKAAEKFRVSRNGQIVLTKDGKRARIDTGLKLKKARKKLSKLDGEFQKIFKEINSSKKVAYFTRGHGEMSWLGGGKKNPLRSLRTVESFLRQQHYSLKQLGISDGSAEKVPRGASVVVIMGPTKPFQSAEVQALKEFIEQGGSLLVYLDVEKDLSETRIKTDKWPLRQLLVGVGLKFNSDMMANDRDYVGATKSERDKWFIHSNVFTSHDSVVSMSKHEERVAVIMFESGNIEVSKKMDGWRTSETVRSLSSTFVDLNKDFKFSKGEKRATYVLGAVSTKKISKKDKKGTPITAKVALFADATMLADAIIRNPGNLLLFSDTLKWTVGDSDLIGDISNEEDVKLVHTRKEDVIWFNATVFVMPLLTLLFGFVATRRRKTSVA